MLVFTDTSIAPSSGEVTNVQSGGNRLSSVVNDCSLQLIVVPFAKKPRIVI